MSNLFVSNRDIVVRSAKAAQAIRFEKGVPQSVPPIMHKEVIEKGILPLDAESIDSVKVMDTPDVKLNLPPEDGDERNARILEVMKAIIQRNNPLDFGGGGAPSTVAVGNATGWRVDQKEIRKLLDENREALARKE